MGYILGAKSHLFLSDETVWGTQDDPPDYVHIPSVAYNVRFRPESRNAQPAIGLRQRKHGQYVRGMPSGTLQTALYGQVKTPPGHSLAQYLLDWAFANPESLELPSKSAEWAEGPNEANKLHTGLRVNSATLSGDDSGQVGLSLELMGQAEADVVTAQTIPTDHELLQEFLFHNATLTLAGSSVGMQSFQWQANNALEVNYLNSFNPSLITAGDRVDTLQCTLVKDGDTYDVYRRTQAATEVTAVLVLKGLHNGTGGVGTNYTVVTITFNRLRFVDFEDQWAMNQLTKIPLQFDVLKPDSGSNAVTIAYSEAA